jgi:hypothetical protein
MIATDCQVLISSDDPPKVLKSASDEVLTDCCNCVERDVTEISTLTVEITVTGESDQCGCTFSGAGGSTSAVFNRINRADSFNPAENQFKLYFVATTPTHCDLVILIQSSVGADQIDPIPIPVDSVCEDCIALCVDSGGTIIDIPGKFISYGELRAFVNIINSNPCGGTLELTVGGTAQVECNAQECIFPQNQGCVSFTTGSADNTITFTYANVPGVVATLSQSETFEGGCSNQSAQGCHCHDPCPGGGFICYPCGAEVECPACSSTATVTATATLA